jgi:hypothetical protein
MGGDPGSFFTLIMGGGTCWRLGRAKLAPGFMTCDCWRDTHDVGELLPFEFERSTTAAFSKEPGEPLLRARLGAGSTRSATGGADGAALVIELNWRGETCRSTAEVREVGGAATTVDIAVFEPPRRQWERRCGYAVVWCALRCGGSKICRPCSCGSRVSSGPAMERETRRDGLTLRLRRGSCA